MYERKLKEILRTKKLNSSDRLNYVRQKNSLTILMLAELIGYSESHTKNLCNGSRDISNAASKIAEGLKGCKYEPSEEFLKCESDFLNFEEEKNYHKQVQDRNNLRASLQAFRVLYESKGYTFENVFLDDNKDLKLNEEVNPTITFNCIDDLKNQIDRRNEYYKKTKELKDNKDELLQYCFDESEEYYEGYIAIDKEGRRHTFDFDKVEEFTKIMSSTGNIMFGDSNNFSL